jgi:hypothetical protein
MSHRVIQWGTGNVGFHGLRHLIRHPDLELVGLHVHAEAKLGRDAGEIAGLDERTGVLATHDVDALIALRPDCVVYTANGELRPKEAVEDMARLLRAGIDVVGTALIYLIYPPHAQAELREPLEEACREGNATLFVNGIDPGFSGDVLPLAALQIAGEVEEIRVQEICDYSTYEDPAFTGVTFGFGQDESASPIMGMPGVLAAGWGGMIELVARAIGVELEEIREVYERDFAKESFECPMMRVEKGQCGAVHFEVQGIVGGRPLIVAEHVNRLGLDQAPHWPKAPDGRRGVHRCIVTGNPGVQLECFTRGEDGDHNTGGVQATALRVINAIPEVCAHAPGIISTLDLPYTPSTHLARG